MLFAAILTLKAGERLVLWHSGTLWVRSLAGSTSLLCTFFALSRLPVADVLALTNTFPIWVALLSWPLLGEAPAPKVWLAVAVGVVGVLLIQQPHLVRGEGAILFAVAASFCSAVAMLGIHRLQGIDTRAIVTHFSGVATLFCVAAFFLFDHAPVQHSLSSDWALAGLLGVGITATIGQLFLTKAFSVGPPAKVSLVALTQIVFGLLVDVTIFDHELNLVSLAGIALVVAPTVWVLGGREEVDPSATHAPRRRQPRKPAGPAKKKKAIPSI
jgi:drug/metabolite transporter (DMT)-like permease